MKLINFSLTSEFKANIDELAKMGISVSEIDPSGREIQFASTEKPALIQIHTDTPMKLRIRLLESPPKREQKLSPKMYISGSDASDWGLSPTQNGTLTRQTNGNNSIALSHAFVHQSRVFYINQASDLDKLSLCTLRYKNEIQFRFSVYNTKSNTE